MANLILWSSYHETHAPIRPHAVYHLASWLRRHNYTVKVIDFCHFITADELANITQRHIDIDTIAIGVSSTFWDMGTITRKFTEPDWVVNARQKVEEKNPKIKWLLGGYGVNYPKLQLNWVKFTGFAEDSILKWIDENCSRLVYRELFDITKSFKTYTEGDLIRPEETLSIELARGCQFKCKFCSYPLIGKRKGTYTREFNLIREEFIRNYNEWGTTKYYFLDDTVNESEEKIQLLADIVQDLPFELSWVGYNRLDLISARPNTIQLLRDSGLKSAYFGIESFQPTASMAIGKGWNGKHGKDFLLELKDKWKTDITWGLSFIIGLPGDTQEDVINTNQWCIDNEMPTWYFQPLFINRSSNTLWKSEFDLNYEKYGYSFPNEQDTFNWKNDLWTYELSQKFAGDITKETQKYRKPAAWMLFELTGLGYDISYLMRRFNYQLPWHEFELKTKKFVDEYVQYQLR